MYHHSVLCIEYYTFFVTNDEINTSNQLLHERMLRQTNVAIWRHCGTINELMRATDIHIRLTIDPLRPMTGINTLRPIQNGRHFSDDILKGILLNENVRISLKISLKFVLKLRINNNSPALVQIVAWRRPGDKPLSEPMMVSLLTHICVTRPQ